MDRPQGNGIYSSFSEETAMGGGGGEGWARTGRLEGVGLRLPGSPHDSQLPPLQGLRTQAASEAHLVAPNLQGNLCEPQFPNLQIRETI